MYLLVPHLEHRFYCTDLQILQDTCVTSLIFDMRIWDKWFFFFFLYHRWYFLKQNHWQEIKFHTKKKNKNKNTILSYPGLIEEELKRFGRSLLESRYYLSYEILWNSGNLEKG